MECHDYVERIKQGIKDLKEKKRLSFIDDESKGTPKERYDYLRKKYKLAFLTIPEFKEIDKSMNELSGVLVDIEMSNKGEIENAINLARKHKEFCNEENCF